MKKHVLTECLWQYHPKWKQPKWKFSTFYGLPGTTSYPYLPLRTIDPPDTRSHPQGGVQIYPQPNHLSKKGKKSASPQIAISLKLASQLGFDISYKTKKNTGCTALVLGKKKEKKGHPPKQRLLLNLRPSLVLTNKKKKKKIQAVRPWFRSKNR